MYGALIGAGRLWFIFARVFMGDKSAYLERWARFP